MVRRNLGLPHRLISKNFNCVIWVYIEPFEWEKELKNRGIVFSNDPNVFKISVFETEENALQNVNPLDFIREGQELRKHVLLLLKIETHNDRIWWTQELKEWYERHKDYINEKTINTETERYWYTHKLLRRSYFTIKRALPNMFHYLDNPKIPKTTNGIEGYFSHLKNHLDLHRGLTLKNRINFIKWYIYFSNEK